MAEAKEVLEALKQCFDPEIPLNIVDLGLIYDVKIENEKAFIKMTLTSMGCPAAQILPEQVKNKAMSIPGIREAEVKLVWDPPWTPEKMTEEGKLILGI